MRDPSTKRLKALRQELVVGCVAALLSALAASACTLSNTSEGGAEGLDLDVRRGGPSDRSVELWFDPGPNLLAALGEVKENDELDVLARDNTVLGLMWSEVGSYYSASIAYQPGGSPFLAQSMQCLNRTLPDAVDVICSALLDPELKYAFIDETPHQAPQRAMGRRILQCAREAGFEYLAVEALEEESAALLARGFVSRTTSGPYMREPQLAGIVNDGIQLGFTPVSFPGAGEFCTDCTVVQAFSQDSEAKALTLLAQTSDQDPDAKVLVWTGPGQAYKQPWGPRPYVNSLASQVFVKTGVDPYSVAQGTLDGRANLGPAPASDMYIATGPNGSCAGSYSPGSANGQSLLNAVVFHVAPPGNGTDASRWAWLHTPAAEQMAVTPECPSCRDGEQLLVQAHPAGLGDISDRVAADQALCLAGAPCQLSLPAGDYQVVIWSAAAELASRQVTLAAGTPVSVTMN